MQDYEPLSQERSGWFELFKKGDAGAYKSAFDLFYRQIAYYAHCILKDPMMAEEVAQESFQKAWRDRSKLESPKHLRNYLFFVARNASISCIRADKHRRQTEQDFFRSLDNNEEVNPADMEKIQTLLIERIYQILQELPHGKVVKMAYIDGKSTGEIANEMGTSENNIYILKSRTLKELRKRLGKDVYLLALLICFKANSNAVANLIMKENLPAETQQLFPNALIMELNL